MAPGEFPTVGLRTVRPPILAEWIRGAIPSAILVPWCGTHPFAGLLLVPEPPCRPFLARAAAANVNPISQNFPEIPADHFQDFAPSSRVV